MTDFNLTYMWTQGLDARMMLLTCDDFTIWQVSHCPWPIASAVAAADNQISSFIFLQMFQMLSDEPILFFNKCCQVSILLNKPIVLTIAAVNNFK